MIAELLALIALLFLSAFFSGSEIALFSSNKIRIRKLMEEGNKSAEVVNWLLEHPNRLLATILVGNNIVNISATVLATSLAINLFGSTGLGIATGAMTFLILVFGEITPKGFAAKNAERIALIVARPMYLLVNLLFPLVRFLTMLTNFMIKAIGGEPKEVSPFITEEEIKMLVEMGEEEGVIEREEKEMINSVFEFGDKNAREVMIPRISMDAIDVNSTLEEALKAALKTRHSRLPVYEGSMDNIVGMLHSKDLLHYIRERRYEGTVREILRPVHYVPENKRLDDLLKEFQKTKTHMAIVVDEYGGTAGLVTLEDILEEIVGEILDEYDAVETNIQVLDERTALVEAKTSVGEVNEALSINLPEDEFDTLGGLVFNRFGKVPAPGDKVEIDGITLLVEKMRGRQIAKVKVIKQS